MSIIDHLFQLIEDRKRHPQEGSYTNQLFNDSDKAVQKIGEEATEVIIAALNQGPERLTSEAADLIYHLLVVLSANGVTLEDVKAELSRRHQKKSSP
ncbi:MAG: phosphoribosyl-ATP diphosphatase [Ardenticatenaceae bacterium]|nr:phosphoribosyl-ATP diphosphatase [Ardenticatenaceae bacterium]